MHGHFKLVASSRESNTLPYIIYLKVVQFFKLNDSILVFLKMLRVLLYCTYLYHFPPFKIYVVQSTHLRTPSGPTHPCEVSANAERRGPEGRGVI